jgi:hypothetical protein
MRPVAGDWSKNVPHLKQGAKGGHHCYCRGWGWGREGREGEGETRE